VHHLDWLLRGDRTAAPISLRSDPSGRRPIHVAAAMGTELVTMHTVLA
jgi:hypothetical protein